MSWTKRQFIEEAFGEIGLAAYVYDLQPDQLESALRRLDSMMAMWNGKGIRIGYPLPSSPEDSDLDEETSVPDDANETIYSNLAIRIAPGFGKTVSSDTKITAKDGYRGLIQKSTKPIERQLPGTMPRGAGNKPWRNTNNEFLDDPVDPLTAGDDSTLDFT